MRTRGELAQQRRRQRPGGGVDAEDLLARRAVGQRKLELPVEAARPAQRRVERVDPVGGTDEDDLPTVRIRVRLGVRVGVGVGVGVRVGLGLGLGLVAPMRMTCPRESRPSMRG